MREIETRQLQRQMSQVLAWVGEGETIGLTRYGKVVAMVVPPPKSETALRESTASEELGLSQQLSQTKARAEQKRRDEILAGVNRKPRSKT
jgi:antitoxin (DNA-binding transcriptional repressor) of toxin-antitoxin stability system